MKIVFFDAVSDSYGSSRICKLVVKIMRQSGHDVSVFVRENHLPPIEQYAKEIKFPLIVVSRIKKKPIKFLLSFIIEIFVFWKFSKKLFEEADLIYCNTLGTLPVCLFARILGKDVVLHVHESNSFNPIIRWLVSKIISFLAFKIILVSNSVLRLWGLEYNPNVRVIRNGIPDFNNVEHIKRSILTNRKYSFLFVGRLIEKKGILLFLKAIELLDKECKKLNLNISVAIVGGPLPGQDIPFIMDDLFRFQFVDVNYLGEVSEPVEFFLDSYVVCVPSTYADPYPTVILESLRAGCSVITSDIGGAKEALANARDCLFKSGDAIELKDLMLKKLTSLSSGSLVNENRQLFCSTHGIDSFKNRLLSFLK